MKLTVRAVSNLAGKAIVMVLKLRMVKCFFGGFENYFTHPPLQLMLNGQFMCN